MGFADVSPQDREKINLGNRLLATSARIARLCMTLCISFVIENPFSSRIWLTKHFSDLRKAGAEFGRTDFCAFNTPWRKSTGFLFWQFPKLADIFAVCLSQHGRCGFSNRKHIILCGKDAAGMWMTRRAQPYPQRMCQQIAEQVRLQCTS